MKLTSWYYLEHTGVQPPVQSIHAATAQRPEIVYVLRLVGQLTGTVHFANII